MALFFTPNFFQYREARPMADEGHPKLDVLLASLHRDHADVLPGV